MQFDHVAIPSNNISQSIQWYRDRFNATVLFADDTWAFLLIGDVKLALVTPTPHPPHIAIRVTPEQLTAASSESGIPIDSHRDGSRGIYLHDPFGNAVELIHYPPGQTTYEGAPPQPPGPHYHR